MPALGGKEEQRRRGIIGKRCVGEGEGLGEHALLDRPPLGIERFELGGDPARLDLIVSGEQLARRGSDAPTLPPALMRGPRI